MSRSLRKLFHCLIIKLLFIYMKLMYSYTKRSSPQKLSRRRRHGLKLKILKRAPFGRKIIRHFLLQHLAGQFHQILSQFPILRQFTPALRHRRRTDILPALVGHRGGEHGADASLELILLERAHADTHGVSA